MLILCRHIQVYTLGRLSIDGFSFERVAQFNLEWIFSKLDSGFLVLDSGFQSPGFRIPRAKNSWIPESGFPYMGRNKCAGKLYSMWPLVRDFFEHEEIFRLKKNTETMNVSDALLISLLSYGEVLAFLLLLKEQNSNLLTGRLICLS